VRRPLDAVREWSNQHLAWNGRWHQIPRPRRLSRQTAERGKFDLIPSPTRGTTLAFLRRPGTRHVAQFELPTLRWRSA
jgi:hypothetical protein